MFGNYFKIALRNLWKYKGYSFINIMGLAIGMAGCILILLFVQDELSYDTFHAHADRIVRLERWGNFQGMDYRTAVSAHPYGPRMVADFPEVINCVRIWNTDLNVRDAQKQFSEQKIYFTDASLFDVFSFHLKEGDPATALKAPSSLVLTEEVAERLTGQKSPLGQTVHIAWGDSLMAFNITGILEEIPSNSHFHTDIFASYSSLDILLGDAMNVWLSNNIVTYLLLAENVDRPALEAKFPAFVDKYMGDNIRQFLGQDTDLTKILNLSLFPILDVHLHSALDEELEANGGITTVYIFSAIAFLILVIAAINFMNLSTARSARRAKEVGLRKVVGAYRKHLILQFLGESILISVVALAVGLLLTFAVLPAYNAFTLKTLTVDFHNPQIMLGVGLITMLVGLLAGLYPAFFLSAFRPILVLKGMLGSRTKGKSAFLREGLVVLQFGISLVLIIATIIVSDQLDFVRNKRLGFDKEQLVVVPIHDNALRQKLGELRSELSNSPSIISVGSSARYPGSHGFSDTVWRREGSGGQGYVSIQHFKVDEFFLPTLGMKMVEGRNFSVEFKTDKTGIILNESAAKKLGWQSPAEAVGRFVEAPNGTSPDDLARCQVVGVVQDFHFRSLRQQIEPLILHMGIMGTDLNYVSIRVAPHDFSETLAFIETTLRRFSPAYPFEYFFLDKKFDSQYRSEKRMETIFAAFTALAIFVACLGLLGLASFAAEQRTKEIGIRKVLGATEVSIVALLARQFVRLVLFGFVVATPVVYFLMKRWLEGFAYRTDISSSTFIWSGLIVLAIAMLTVSFQAIRAALANPVDALQYE